jgi:two-component system, probable response regulator PhcQ
MTIKESAHILLVDDEVSIVRSLGRALRQSFAHSLLIDTCNSGADALEMLRERRFDVIVSDLRMPGMGGMELLEKAAKVQPDCVRMILTGTSDFSTAQEAMNGFGVYRYLTKPWEIDELVKHMGAAIQHGASLRAQREQALEWAASQGKVSPQEVERHRLEAMEPGITHVEWDEDGCFVLPLHDSP